MANVSSFSGAMPVIPGGLVETGYVTRTTDYTIASTTVAGAADVFSSDLTFMADGGPYLVEFTCGRMITTSGGPYINVYLVDGSGTSIGMLGLLFPGGTQAPGHFQFRVQPSAGSVSYNVRSIYSSAGSASLAAGTGAGGNQIPMMLRVSKIVNQNDGLKPFWTPPVVTQLPSQATVGDQVLYAADATNGVYWQLQYDGLGTYPWKFIGGSALGTQHDNGTQYTLTHAATTYTDILTTTVPLTGDYSITGATLLTSTSGCDAIACINTTASRNTNYWVARSANGGTQYENGCRTVRFNALAASTVISLADYHVATGSGSTVGNASLYVTPIRVSA